MLKACPVSRNPETTRYFVPKSCHKMHSCIQICWTVLNKNFLGKKKSNCYANAFYPKSGGPPSGYALSADQLQFHIATCSLKILGNWAVNQWLLHNILCLLRQTGKHNTHASHFRLVRVAIYADSNQVNCTRCNKGQCHYDFFFSRSQDKFVSIKTYDKCKINCLYLYTVKQCCLLKKFNCVRKITTFR